MIKLISIIILLFITLGVTKYKKLSAFTFLIGLIVGMVLKDGFFVFLGLSVFNIFLVKSLKIDKDDIYIPLAITTVLGIYIIKAFNGISLYNWSYNYLFQNFYLLMIIKAVYLAFVGIAFTNMKKIYFFLAYIMTSVIFALAITLLDFSKKYNLMTAFRQFKYEFAKGFAGVLIVCVVIFLISMIFGNKEK